MPTICTPYELMGE